MSIRYRRPEGMSNYSSVNNQLEHSNSMFTQSGITKSSLKNAGLQSYSMKNLLITTNSNRGASQHSITPIKLRNHTQNETRFRTQIIVVNCDRHTHELLKFIDVNSKTFETQCDLCLVDSEKPVNTMKLERILDLQDKIRHVMLTNIQQLKELEQKVDSLTREINVANALRSPLMDLIDDMEKTINKQIEFNFKRLREKFTVLNPFADVKANLKEKMDTMHAKVRVLDSQGSDSLMMLKELLKETPKMKEEIMLLRANVTRKIDNAKNYDPSTHKDFSAAQNAYDEFADMIKKMSQKFLASFMKI